MSVVVIGCQTHRIVQIRFVERTDFICYTLVHTLMLRATKQNSIRISEACRAALIVPFFAKIESFRLLNSVMISFYFCLKCDSNHWWILKETHKNQICWIDICMRVWVSSIYSFHRTEIYGKNLVSKFLLSVCVCYATNAVQCTLFSSFFYYKNSLWNSRFFPAHVNLHGTIEITCSTVNKKSHLNALIHWDSTCESICICVWSWVGLRAICEMWILNLSVIVFIVVIRVSAVYRVNFFYSIPFNSGSVRISVYSFIVFFGVLQWILIWRMEYVIEWRWQR